MMQAIQLQPAKVQRISI